MDKTEEKNPVWINTKKEKKKIFRKYLIIFLSSSSSRQAETTKRQERKYFKQLLHRYYKAVNAKLQKAISYYITES